ncbi:carbohydrate ABC transporter permease [Catenuloplanes sp. NPDC051500]|uniref:carbohydrate ABC transporter permease n=1 Tax=Catenuloplanes sp. NPDC051500 TaxID=3363959 RepID=UPI0037A368F9
MRVRVIVLAALAAVAGFPLYWMVVTATRTQDELFGGEVHWLPDLTRLGTAFTAATDGVPMLRWLTNSAFVAAGTTVLSLVLAVLAAYALSRFSWRGRGVFGFALFATQMLPEALIVVPLYAIFLTLGLLNNLWGLVLGNTAFAMPVAVWIIKTAMDGVPRELEEAAALDGCSRYAMLRRIVLPLTAPSLAAAAVLAFFDSWNEFLLANTFMVDEEKWPASKGLASFVGEFVTPLPTVMSAAVLFTLPAVVFFLLVQRHIVAGLTAGAVKG